MSDTTTVGAMSAGIAAGVMVMYQLGQKLWNGKAAHLICPDGDMRERMARVEEGNKRIERLLGAIERKLDSHLDSHTKS